jgi:hypothetical protein
VNSPLAWLEQVEVDALHTDRYLEALLASAERGATDAPAPADVDQGLRAAARVLRDSAVRVHPSFRFEERLARRLAAAAADLRLAAAAGGEGSPVIAFPVMPDPAEDVASPAAHAPRPVRPLLVGGALTSAALSIAGAAYVAWRRTRTGTLPQHLPSAGFRIRADLPRRLD